MVSDVPIGAFLSAGLDSSSIVALMCRARKQPVSNLHNYFSARISRGETTLDDPQVPAQLARQLGCEHREIIVEPDVADYCPG